MLKRPNESISTNLVTSIVRCCKASKTHVNDPERTSLIFAASSIMEPEKDDRISMQLRELRHNPCLMAPLSAILLMAVALLSLVTLALRIPALLLGALLSPALARSSWLVGKYMYMLVHAT